ncbi:RagB/SusD family nutrient uptake outer membrane protein [Mucilaginibacter sp. UR6-1]|uniref:RagB/SusD family nutrient uptake outer membrane protein n=1 Tax=Mucilaginibacter sp. UR6-1 TaxID=1435643 RepID=UPI001E292A64|nr:RagB/SusD family nutrient uptake outer membrane protein [Mucilaginibacter sp. UR6-1]MCC8411262.1 RagB/SusD family nutrient uptake outer membrane protein [Mucilaginibacter sp. UR6-1]
MKSTNNIKILIIVTLLSLTSCQKVLDIDAPTNERPSGVVFGSDDNAKAALSGAYSQLGGTQTYGSDLTLITGLAADELKTSSPSVRYVQLQNNTYDAINNSLIRNAWEDSYTSLYRFNAIIAGLSSANGVTPAVAQQMLGEAKAMRAYILMSLVSLYGDVPLILTTNVQETATMPKTPAAQVWQQIITDLTEAKEELADAYVSNNGSAQRMQINKSGAAALLAKAYLATGQWALAVSNASEVISNTTLYGLLPGTQLSDVFLANSRESILQLGSAFMGDTGYTGEGSIFIPSAFTSAMNFAIRDGLLNAFENNDRRRDAWVRTYTLNGVTTNQPFKYQNVDRDAATASGRTESVMVIRLAEVYLVRAEANARLSNAGQAVADLNVLRTRAGLAALPVTVNLLNAVEQERRVELFCERGDRWFTLKRNGNVNQVIGALKPQTWTETAQLFPIPQTAIDANPNLIQNPGYR